LKLSIELLVALTMSSPANTIKGTMGGNS